MGMLNSLLNAVGTSIEDVVRLEIQLEILADLVSKEDEDVVVITYFSKRAQTMFRDDMREAATILGIGKGLKMRRATQSILCEETRSVVSFYSMEYLIDSNRLRGISPDRVYLMNISVLDAAVANLISRTKKRVHIIK